MFRRIYLAGALATLVYLLAFDGFVYSHGDWATQTPAAFVASMLWPIYWGVVYWL